MPQFTKRAIIASFLKLAAKTSLDKITVKDIVEDCGVTRNTFYYYFRDVYDVIDDIFLTETSGVLSSEQQYTLLSDALLSVNDFVFQHRAAIRNIYNSLGRDKVELYISRVTGHALDRFIAGKAAGQNADPGDLALITAFYREAILGMMLSWIRDDIQVDPVPRVRRLESIFRGQIENVIKASIHTPHVG